MSTEDENRILNELFAIRLRLNHVYLHLSAAADFQSRSLFEWKWRNARDFLLPYLDVPTH